MAGDDLGAERYLDPVDIALDRHPGAKIDFLAAVQIGLLAHGR